ncbi:MAG: hypothetical protein ACREGR_02165 [Minisyncoccia bacterium]
MTAQTITITRDKRRTDPIGSGGVSYPKNRGGFDVFVNGYLWGRTQQQTHGCHGSTHELLQVTTAANDRQAYAIEKRKLGRQGERLGDRHIPINIWSDKVYLRNLKTGEVAIPLEDRIKQMVADAIKDGWLRDPVKLAAEAKQAADKARAAEAKRLQEKNAEWMNRANEAIGSIRHLMTAEQEAQLRTQIVKAMEWAQTK